MAMQPWFQEAKLGIFIHWGIYAVDGVEESWSFFRGDVSYDTYMAQLDGFTAAAFDADEWASVFRRSGARYAVLTAKHHDGVALWDTTAGDISVARHTPAGRDLVGEFTSAMRRHDIHPGLYYSHLDWSHPAYASLRPAEVHNGTESNRFTAPSSGVDDLGRWEGFLRFHRAQLDELVSEYDPDLLWFDGEWERTAQQWGFAQLRAHLDEVAPRTVLNGRLLGYGDYSTPEQGPPITPPDGAWELCLTVNDYWGYRGENTTSKSARQLIRVFAEVVGAGGNLLLDVGPRADGVIPAAQTDRLCELGSWISRHTDAIYGTQAGLPPGCHYGPSTLSSDRRTLYIFCFDPPREFVAVRGVRNAIRRATVVSTGEELAMHNSPGLGDVPGICYFDAPASADDYATVIAVELDGEIDLYLGPGRT